MNLMFASLLMLFACEGCTIALVSQVSTNSTCWSNVDWKRNALTVLSYTCGLTLSQVIYNFEQSNFSCRLPDMENLESNFSDFVFLNPLGQDATVLMQGQSVDTCCNLLKYIYRLELPVIFSKC